LNSSACRVFSPIHEFRAMAQAIFQSGGKQYRVTEGETLDIEKLELEPGSEAIFENVLYINTGITGDNPQVGAPLLTGAKVTAEVVDQRKGDKVIAYKYRRRKGYQRTVGHRQKLTRVKITAISA